MIPTLRRQRQVELCGLGQPGLHSAFEASLVYIETLSQNKQTNKQMQASMGHRVRTSLKKKKQKTNMMKISSTLKKTTK